MARDAAEAVMERQFAAVRSRKTLPDWVKRERSLWFYSRDLETVALMQAAHLWYRRNCGRYGHPE